MKLNRIRYKLEEQEEFIRFHLTVHGALAACRVENRGLNRAGDSGGILLGAKEVIMSANKRYPPDIKAQAIRMVFEHQGQYESQRAAISFIAKKTGCPAGSLRAWIRQAEKDKRRQPGFATDEREQMKQLEREIRELMRANEILRLAFALIAH